MGGVMGRGAGLARRTTPMPPRPGGVATATMVSSRFTALIVMGEPDESAVGCKPTVNMQQHSSFGYRALGDKPRQKEAGAPAVFCEGSAELLCQHLFFNASFCVERDPNQRDADHGAPLCDGQCSSHQRP